MTNRISDRPGDLHMIQLTFEPRKLVELGRMLHLPLRQADTGYLVHCALGELFQQNAPSPYWIEDEGREVRVLAYSELAMAQLHELASAYASPTVYQTVQWSRSHSKPMPSVFPAGTRLGFEVRAAPTVRLGSAISVAGRPPLKKGAEVDVFLARQLRQPEEQLEREPIYESWLTDRLDATESLDVDAIKMKRFMLSKMLRRSKHVSEKTGRRKAHTITLPDVTFEGALTVKSDEQFRKLLAQGLGRHKAFGFGMIKLRRL